MKNFILMLAVVLGFIVSLAACDKREQQNSGTSAAPSASRMSDSDLEKAVRASLETDAQLKEANLSVNAIAERNEITLSGTVRPMLHATERLNWQKVQRREF
jgi:osmotically-inducible protein OsmY